ncbi:unnamed protein product, partial [Prorocentrum cordatum]
SAPRAPCVGGGAAPGLVAGAMARLPSGTCADGCITGCLRLRKRARRPCCGSLESELLGKGWTPVELLPILETGAMLTIPSISGRPAICTATVYRIDEGTSGPPSEYLRRRVAEVVRANPWLAGRLATNVGARGCEPQAALWVPPPHSAGDCFFEQRDAFGLDAAMPCSEMAAQIVRSAAALKSGLESIDRDQPLFRVTLAALGATHFVVVVAMCHAIGDGHTFYSIYGMLGESSQVLPMTVRREPGFVSAAAAAVGEQHFSWLARLPAVVGALCMLCRWGPEAPAMRSVCPEWVRQRKARHAQSGDGKVGAVPGGRRCPESDSGRRGAREISCLQRTAPAVTSTASPAQNGPELLTALDGQV